MNTEEIEQIQGELLAAQKEGEAAIDAIEARNTLLRRAGVTIERLKRELDKVREAIQ